MRHKNILYFLSVNHKFIFRETFIADFYFTAEEKLTCMISNLVESMFSYL